MKRTPTEEQKQVAAARREKFKRLAKQLSAMPKAQRDALAARLPAIATIEGCTLSVFNTCLVAAQMPGATVVGGFRQWLKAGRSVRKGEHGASLWVPFKTKAAEGADDSADAVRFGAGVVFDVAQTEEIAAEEPKATCAQVVADHFDPSSALRKAGVLEVIHVAEGA